jgi:hypothetical protein
VVTGQRAIKVGWEGTSGEPVGAVALGSLWARQGDRWGMAMNSTLGSMPQLRCRLAHCSGACDGLQHEMQMVAGCTTVLVVCEEHRMQSQAQ